MKVVKTLTGYCQCNKVCGSPLTYAGEGSHVVAEPDDDNLGKGAEKKQRISYGLFTEKKIYTHFFLEIESMIAKTNFTLGPIEKFIFFVKL